MRITLAQLNYHVGNFTRNRELICEAIRKAKDQESDLVIFSELSVSGYPPLDLLDRYDFIRECGNTVQKIADECIGITAIVGAPVINQRPEGKKLFNSALMLSEGKIIFAVHKALLPTYDIFDEYRYFEPEKSFSTFTFKGLKIALTICEDLWDEQPFDNEFEKTRLYTISPMEELAKQNPDLIINISASPFSYSKVKAKEEIFKSKAVKYRLPVITVNQTGANTELIFDGASSVINTRGEIVYRLPFFEEEIFTFSLDDALSQGKAGEETGHTVISLIHKALVTGIRDYFGKMNFTNCILGLSGGLDSAVTLCLATNALGKEHVRALLMPSSCSSDHSVSDSVELADRLGVRYEILSIGKLVESFEETLSPFFEGRAEDITEENIQARIRAVLLMAFSNKFNYILLNTSNKSEAAVGYGTLYGDMAGGLSVIGDVYKSDVYHLARYINRNGTIIPRHILEKPPSAELRPNQLDTDSLPDYSILDSILYQYIELQKSPENITVPGADFGLITEILWRINANEYKRYQSPPVLRISSKAFGAGRRMPLVARF